jgi:UDP-2,3-diacylglucosamine pyrophosphatase LpxH
LLWRYKVSDRIRGIRAADLNGDGKIEIAVGSEDYMVYLLQVLDQPQLHKHIERCWAALQEGQPTRELIHELARNPDPYLRAFALVKLASQAAGTFNQNFEVLRELVNDRSDHVRMTFAQTIAPLYQASPDQTRRFLDVLAASRERDIRLAFVGSLADLVQVDRLVGFEYLDRFTRDADRWVRRAVVRQLHRLVSSLPQEVFRCLLITIQDEKEWIRQETARTLAHYFNIHTYDLIIGLRRLIVHGIALQYLSLIAYRSEQPIVHDLILAVVALLSSDLDEANILDRLEITVRVLDKARTLPYGEETWQVYCEFYRLHRMRTIDEIAGYTYTLGQIQLVDPIRFEETLQLLRDLTDIAGILGTYLRREGLGDRLASLLEATTALEKMHTDVGRQYIWVEGQRPRFPDRLVFEILLTKWRAMVTAELRRLRGKADLKPELRTKLVHLEDQIGIWLDIRNLGHSPADNVKVVLKQSDDFAIVGNNYLNFETVPTQNEVRAEFTIQPNKASFHLAFELFYNDAEAKAKVLLFGDLLELQTTKHEFKRIPNPYIPGIPIQDRTMFYGREADLDFLKENLTFLSANMIVVLYGQRRSGKSSLLYQLFNTSMLEPHVPVYIDMQHESLGISTSKFLRNMATSIYRSLKRKNIAISQPRIKDFDKEPTFTFDLFLDDVEDVLKDRKLVILIDEFEILEQKVTEKALSREIFEYLRSLMQHRRRINFLLSGTHTIEQLTAGYWSVFFNIARHRRLSKLTEEAAIQLISEPVKGFLECDPFAIQKIRQLTADQPYLIQLICRSLVEHCNRLQKSYATINDVNTVMGEVMETGQVHFKWVWDQSNLQERLVLSVIAQEGRDEGLSASPSDIEKVYRHYGLAYDHESVMRAIQSLIGRDIIEEVSEGTRFRVPVGLIRGWLREAKPLRRVMLQEKLLAQ